MLDEVYALLSGDSELMGLVKDVSYYYPEGFDEPMLPTISYYSPNDNPINAFEGIVGTHFFIHIDVWGKSAEVNNAIASRVVEVLKGILLNYNNINLFETDTKIHHKVIQLKGI